MAKVHVQESFPTASSVKIKVDGVLDIEALKLIEQLWLHHIERKLDIYLDLNDVVHLGQEARHFLKGILPHVKKISLPPGQLL